jgi:hypothetical protein
MPNREGEMQLYNGLSIDEVIEHQNELFVPVPVVIDPRSRENDCYLNCVSRAEMEGGEVVVGWRRTSAVTDAELIATLDQHAIWRSPSGDLIDISRRIRIINNRM